jgi:hypothetical protein
MPAETKKIFEQNMEVVKACNIYVYDEEKGG